MNTRVKNSFRSVRRAFYGALGGLVVSFVGAAMMGACAAPVADEPACSTTEAAPPVEQSTACTEPTLTPCKRYYIPLLGNPSMSDNIELRKKYKAEFGSACYVAADANSTFNCWYKEEDILGPKKDGKGQACTDAKRIGEVSGLAVYDQDKKYVCKKNEATGDWWVQVGSDSANKIDIKLGDAPLQHPLILVDGTPTLEINGPYRNLVEVTNIKPGKDFYCTSGQPKPDGGTFTQREWIFEVNRKKHGDNKIHSDLAGYKYPCKKGCKEECTEPNVLNEPQKTVTKVYDEDEARVDHVASMKDPRDCKWGTNAYKNALVISWRLNQHFSNNDRPKEVIEKINAIPPYTP